MNFDQNQKRKPPVTLKLLEWKWLLCYGDNNWFDFNAVSQKVCTINAGNDSGKSSFFEILCLSLFGDPIPSRHNKENSASVICCQKPSTKSAETRIQFMIGNDDYVLYRTFKKKVEDATKLHIDVNELYETDSTGQLRLIKKGFSEIKKWMGENVGNFDSFLLSCLLTQNSDNDFFMLKKDDQAKLLDEALHLESIDLIKNLFKETQLAYKYIVDNTDSIYTSAMSILKHVDKSNLDQIQAQYNLEKKDLDGLELELNDIREVWHQFPEKDLLMENLTIGKLINDCQENINKVIIKTGRENINKLFEEQGSLNAEFKDLQLHYTPNPTPTNLNDLSKQLFPLQSKEPVKFVYGQQHLEQELTKINHLKQKWTHLEFSPSLHTKNKTLLTNLKSRVERQSAELGQLLYKKPNQSNKAEDEYKSWKSKYDGVCDEIKSKYQSIDQLKSFCQRNPIIKPTIKQNQLGVMENQLLSEKSKLINKKWLRMDETAFNKEYQVLSEKYKVALREKESNEKQNQQIQELLKNIKKKWRTVSDAVKNLRVRAIKEPKETRDACDIWQQEYQQRITLKDKYKNYLQNNETLLEQIEDFENKIESQQQTINNIKSQLSQIRNNDHPYNPNCWACQQQSWKLQLDQLENQEKNEMAVLQSLNKQLSDCLLNRNKKQVIIDRDNAQKWIYEWVDSFETKQEYWLQQQREWKVYLPYSKNLKEQEKLNDEYYEQFEKINEELNQHNKILKTHITGYKETKKLFDNISYYKDNRDRWAQTEQLISEHKQIINNYNQNQLAHTILDNMTLLENEFKQWQEEIKMIENFKTWSSKKSVLENKHKQDCQRLSTLEKEIQDHGQYLIDHQELTQLEIEYKRNKDKFDKWSSWKQQMQQLKASINREKLKLVESEIGHLEKRAKWEAELKHWENIQKIRPQFLKKNKLKKLLSDKKVSVTQLQSQLDKLKCAYEEYQKAMENNAKVAQYIEKLKMNKIAISHITEMFEKFKSWLYAKIIIPNLLEETNRIVHTITEHDNYQLKAEVTAKNTFSWSTSDGNNTHIIEKAGGFRKFVFGLAIRIALSYLGVSRVICKQLFIDEGFVSADKDNLDKIPEFIRSLLSIYDGILIVSHLDVIKESGNINVTIKRSGGKLSQLQFGNEPLVVNKIELEAGDESGSQKGTCNHKLNNGKFCKNKIKNGSYCWKHPPKIRK